MRDTLFLLAPGFFDNDRREYCPECAEMWGILSYFPAIKESVDICYQQIAKPRADIVAVLDHYGLQKLTALVRRRLDKVLEVYF